MRSLRTYILAHFTFGQWQPFLHQWPITPENCEVRGNVVAGMRIVMKTFYPVKSLLHRLCIYTKFYKTANVANGT